MNKTVPLIWQTPPGMYSEFEFEWITQVLFAGVPQERIMDCGSLETVRDGAVIIYSCNQHTVGDSFLRYLERYAESGCRFFLLHLSNENLNHDCSYYAQASHVFRNYFDRAITAGNVTYLPLGFQSGFLNLSGMVPGPSMRIHDAVFIGQPKGDRVELINVVSTLPRHFLHVTKAWACQTSLSPAEVSKLYASTRYVPCPKGWIHEDSFRICEALEWGAVPVLRDYGGSDVFSRTLPGHPFPVVKEWGELPEMIRSTDYPSLHARCREWYLDRKKEIAAEILRALEETRS